MGSTTHTDPADVKSWRAVARAEDYTQNSGSSQTQSYPADTPAPTPYDLNHFPCPETVNTQKPMWEKILPSWNKGSGSLQVRTRTPRKKECCEHLELPLSVYVIKKTLGLPPGLWFGNYCCHGHPSKQSVPEVPHLNMGLEFSATERKSDTRYIKSTTELTIHDFFSYLEGCLVHRQPVNMF